MEFSTMHSLKEQNLNKNLDRVFGNTSAELKAVVKMALMKNSRNEEQIKYQLAMMREDNKEDIEYLEEEMQLTYGPNGVLGLCPSKTPCFAQVPEQCLEMLQ